MKKVRFSLVVLLVLCFLVSIIGCSAILEGTKPSSQVETTQATQNSGGSESQKPSESSKPEEKATISILLWRNGNINYPDDTRIQQIIGEKLNINLKTIFVMSPDLQQKKTTLIASGEIPDIMPVNISEVNDFAKGNLIHELDDLLDKYGKNITAKYSEDSFKALTVDGKKYGVPAQTKWGRVTVFRGDWLDNIGISRDFFEDYTLDDYYNIMEQFTNGDPDKNGENDTFGMAASNDILITYDHIFCAFGYRITELYEKDNLVLPGALFPELKEAILFLRKMYQNGLMDPEFAITSDTIYRDKISSGKFGSFYNNYPLASSEHNVTQALIANVPGAYLVATPPPKGPNGHRGNAINSPSEYMAISVISQKSKSPEKAMQYLDYICSDEGYVLAALGEEGRTFVVENGKAKIIAELDQLIADGVGAFQIQTLNPNPPAITSSEEAVKLLALAEKYGKYGIQFTEATPSQKEYKQTLDQIIIENYLKMIMEDGDIDKQFADFTKVYMENGGEILGKERFEMYERKNK